MDASVAAVISQIKLPATAICSSVFLGRTVSKARLFALWTIFLGSLGVGAWKIDGSQHIVDNIHMLATLAVLAESCISAFSSVYTQWLFEGSLDTLWIRNAQLGLLSMIMYMAKAAKEPTCFDNAGHAVELMVDSHGTVIMVLQACSGISVALTLLWLGATEKALASISSIVLTTVWEHVGYLHTWPTMLQVILDLIVVNGIIMYSTFQ